jgi:small-conductance mechanosensitive channel
MLLDWTTIIIDALKLAGQRFLNFVPLLLGAIIIFVIGWMISVAIGKLVSGILSRLSFNKLFDKTGWKGMLDKAELKTNASDFIGGIVKWLLIIVFLMVAVKILGFSELAAFLNSVLAYLPNVVIAALIFVVTVIVADIVEKVVRATAEGFKVGYGKLVSAIVKWSIWIFAGMAILAQLNVAKDFMTSLFAGVINVIVISFGVAFGLGGKDVAGELIRDLRNKFKQ